MRAFVTTGAYLVAVAAAQMTSPAFAFPTVHDLLPIEMLQGADAWRSVRPRVVVPALSHLFRSAALDVDTADVRLAFGTTDAFKALRTGLRRIVRFFRWSATRWAEWLLRAAVFLVVTIVAPLLDRELVSTWRAKGWRSVRHALVLGTAVHLRLLVDRESPVFGKLVVVAALIYGVVSSDLVPDKFLPIGALDDVVAIVIASRGFMLLCPQRLVEAHAMHAANTRDGLRDWQRERSESVPPLG